MDKYDKEGRILDRPWPSKIEFRDIKFDRRWSCFDLTDCKHITNSIFYAGDWQVQVCCACGHSESICEHRRCEWSPDETLLRCTTCGIDAT
jgi:hypothetical protein